MKAKYFFVVLLFFSQIIIHWVESSLFLSSFMKVLWRMKLIFYTVWIPQLMRWTFYLMRRKRKKHWKQSKLKQLHFSIKHFRLSIFYTESMPDTVHLWLELLQMRSIFRLLFIHLGRILFMPNSQHNVSVDTIKVWIQLKLVFAWRQFLV